jgi:hypothetical protein
MTLAATFDTRRQADMVVERLVQGYGVERTDIFVSAEGDANSAGETKAGADTAAGAPSSEERDDAASSGRISVSVDIGDDAVADEIKAAFAEFGAQDLSEQ